MTPNFLGVNASRALAQVIRRVTQGFWGNRWDQQMKKCDRGGRCIGLYTPVMANIVLTGLAELLLLSAPCDF